MLIAAALAGTLGGCSEVADLQEHKLYPGFPDSVSVPCSNGSEFVECNSVQDKPQDGHFLIGRPAYEVSGTEVHDTLTDLTWYRTPGDPDNHADAVDYCDVLPGNYRLPTRIELISLLDFRAKSAVHIDTTMFPGVQPTPYWTASPYQSSKQNYWTVDLGTPATSDHLAVSTYDGNNAGILCVKSASEPYHSGPFITAGIEDRFLFDTRTGLMWMTTPIQMQADWIDYLESCKKAPDGGYGDFRMPNVKELATIVDDANTISTEASILPGFQFKTNQILWSSTPSNTAGYFYALNIMGGSIGQQPGSVNYHSTLCVRGPD